MKKFTIAPFSYTTLQVEGSVVQTACDMLNRAAAIAAASLLPSTLQADSGWDALRSSRRGTASTSTADQPPLRGCCLAAPTARMHSSLLPAAHPMASCTGSASSRICTKSGREVDGDQ